jgi:hypothetical protein
MCCSLQILLKAEPFPPTLIPLSAHNGDEFRACGGITTMSDLEFKPRHIEHHLMKLPDLK